MARTKVYEVDLDGPGGFRRTAIEASSADEAKELVQRLEDANVAQRQNEIRAYTALAEEDPDVVVPADYPQYTVTDAQEQS